MEAHMATPPVSGDTSIDQLRAAMDEAIAKSNAVAKLTIKFGADMSVVNAKNHVGKASQLS
jgi:hypothetical protein